MSETYFWVAALLDQVLNLDLRPNFKIARVLRVPSPKIFDTVPPPDHSRVSGSLPRPPDRLLQKQGVAGPSALALALALALRMLSGCRKQTAALFALGGECSTDEMAPLPLTCCSRGLKLGRKRQRAALSKEVLDGTQPGHPSSPYFVRY